MTELELRLLATREHAVKVLNKLREACLRSPQPIVTERLICVAQILYHLNYFGFPENGYDAKLPHMLRLVVQEANYDDLNWHDQHADLRQLTDLFEIDCMLRHHGRNRNDLSEEEFLHYARSDV